MVGVEDLQDLIFRFEEALSLGERDTVLPLVAEVLRIIPLEVRERVYKSLA
jgi:hypothetical protein